MTLRVQDKSPEVVAMAEPWPVITALRGGTAAMRAAGRTYLPQQPRELNEDYAYRLATATLFPAFMRTVDVMAGKPFSKEATLSDDTPEQIKELADDIDGAGRSLHAFCASVMERSAMSYGIGGILVDYTRTEGRALTQADARAIGARPYWVHITEDQILGWKTQVVDGREVLTQLRLSEAAKVDDGEYGTKTVNRVRVLRPGSFELWQESDTSGKYVLVDQGTTTLSVIPFAPIHGIRVSMMEGRPPLLDLAYDNVKHWQQQSDQDDSARYSRKRLLVFSGIEEGDLSSVTAASSAALTFTSPNAKVEVVQGSAESVTVGRTELDALENQMVRAGAELLVSREGQRTATEAANDAEANKSVLQRITENFEDSVDNALQFTAMWLGLPEGGNIQLFKDFAAYTLGEAAATMLVSLHGAGVITKQTVIRESQRRGILSPDIDPLAELDAVEAEGPALGVIGGDGQ